MKIVSLLLFCLTVPTVVAEWPEFNRHGRRLQQDCDLQNIMDECFNVQIPTADPETYPTKRFPEYERELIKPLMKYDHCLKHNPQCEGKDNPDKAMPWAVMHFICTHWEFKDRAQYGMYKCMKDDMGCELEGWVPKDCEGLNDGAPTSDAGGQEQMEEAIGHFENFLAANEKKRGPP